MRQGLQEYQDSFILGYEILKSQSNNLDSNKYIKMDFNVLFESLNSSSLQEITQFNISINKSIQFLKNTMLIYKRTTEYFNFTYIIRYFFIIKLSFKKNQFINHINEDQCQFKKNKLTCENKEKNAYENFHIPYSSLCNKSVISCLNEGVEKLIHSFNKKFYECACECKSENFGNLCQYKNRCVNCQKNACIANNTCIKCRNGWGGPLQLNNEKFECDCKDNFYGRFCEINCSNVCASNNCSMKVNLRKLIKGTIYLPY
ncbi:hypothetical protein HZS_104 [Henneguya salminicola]|nr:hypothetical protein HZS_104 [Henneguya salminicola]